MLKLTFNMSETLCIAVILLILGNFIKGKVNFFKKYFIPAPVIGGVIFSIITLIGYNSGSFTFSFDSALKDMLMVAFFTTIGFGASLQTLKKGGIQVFTFLIVATVLVVIQNGVGVFLAKSFGLNPLIGIAAGSIPLTGGHGTSGAFGPLLEQAGAQGALSVAIASATFGLVAGCLIGGPVAKTLLSRYNLVGPSHIIKEKSVLDLDDAMGGADALITEQTLFRALILIVVSMGLGDIVGKLIKPFFTLPAYIGPMLVAALIRNIADAKNIQLKFTEISIIGNISLSLFLSIALMTMRLWDLAALAVPLIVILLIQTAIMGLYAYFVTFRVMGKDYDAAVMASGHCGFGLGATPNAMANMESFTAVNGPSVKAFFVLPLVGALFIDFTNASIITIFMNFFK